MGSIPTRSRHRRFITALALAVAAAAPLAAQDTAAVVPDTVAADSVAGPRRVAPLGAFARSLLLPGWGQLHLGRKVTAGLFVATEALTLGMSIKATRDVSRLREQGADSAAIAAKKRTREDWYVLLAVNHLVAGLEAFIAAQLLDFPAELKVERAPDRVTAGLAVPFRLP